MAHNTFRQSSPCFRSWLRSTSRAIVALAILAAGMTFVGGEPSSAQSAQSAGATRWFKGNLHTHTLNSDGDSTPDEVVRWYREHGYDFLVLTDHNFVTGVEGLNLTQGAPGKFLVVKGEEVTGRS